VETVTYKLFGFIPLWTVTRRVDEDALYERIAKRVLEDLRASLQKARG
jgi:hypothetical protein